MIEDSFSKVFEFLNFDDLNMGVLNGSFSAINDADFDRKICFVDGGNLELVKAPNFSVHLMRLYFNTFRNNKKQKTEKNFFEFLCLAKTIDSRFCRSRLIPLNENAMSFPINDLDFDSLEANLMSEGKRASVSVIPQKVRRIMEWKLASEVINSSDEKDVVVMDGTLQSTFSNEQKFAAETQASALKKNVYLTALAKTSTLITETGFPLLSAISMQARGRTDAWYYYPIEKSKHASSESFAVKLHPKAAYIFKFEHFDRQAPDIKSLFSCLKSNSADSTFLGYPYGLIDADNNAKIYVNEKNSYLSFLFPKLSKLRKFIISSDAHDLLNLVW